MKNLFALLFGLLISSAMVLVCGLYLKESTQEGIHPEYRNLRPPLEIFEKIDPTHSKTYPTDFSKSDLDTSKRFFDPPNPPESYPLEVRIKGREEPLYSIYIHQDELGRRKVSHAAKQQGDIALILIGCSYTWGEGVEGPETFASHLSQKFPQVSVYNLGRDGTALHRIYHEIHNKNSDFYLKFKEKKLIIVNTFLRDHLLRQSCDQTCYSRNSWMTSAPRYELSESGIPQLNGSLSDIYPPNSFLSFLWGLKVFDYFIDPKSRIFSESNYNLWLALLTQIRREYKKHYEVLEFYNYFQNPNSTIANNLTPKLLEKGFNVIVGRHHFEVFTEEHQTLIPNDFHPTPLGHKLMAEELAWALKRDFPKLE